MGVRRLQTYLETYCPDACYMVAIASLVNEFRDLYQEDPVIVIDGSSCFRPLYGKLDWVCGGQFKEFEAVVTDFFLKLKDLGVKLVVFFDGAIHDHKRSIWVERRYSDMQKAHSILNTLKDKEGSMSAIDKGDFLVPSGISRVMETVSRSYADEVFRSVEEHTVDIARYAEKNKCMAILGQNSDFVMFNLSVTKYLSIEKLLLPTMSTLIYDRVELASFLELDLSDLPVLATLMGNGTFLYYELNRFHKKMLGGPYQHRNPVTNLLVKKLASLVKDLPKGEELYSYLGELSKTVFGTPNRAQDLKKCITHYDLSATKDDLVITGDDTWSLTVKKAFEEHIKLVAPSQMFSLLKYHTYEMSTALEDYRSEAHISAIILAPFRQRMYGVALMQDPSEDKIVREFCMSGAKSLDAAINVEPYIPPNDFPGLLDMWEKDCKTVISNLNVLLWICSESLYDACLADKLTSVPPEILAPLCVLSFLYKDASALEDYDVKVFAAVAVDLHCMDQDDLSKIEISKVDVRGIQLASLYTRTINTLMVANALTGHPISSEVLAHQQIFDGKLFQSKYSIGDSEQLLEKGSKSTFDLLCNLVLE